MRSLAALAALALAAAPTRALPAEPAPRVASVELRLPPGVDAAELRALVPIEAGEPLSTRALRLAVQRLWQTGRFRNVVVLAEDVAAPAGEEGRWVALVVEAEAVRLLSSVTVRLEGPEVLDAGRVRTLARLAPGEPFDDADLAAAAERVRAALARRGHRAAAVEARVVRGTVAELVVRAGEPVRIAEVRLTGEAGPLAVAPPLRARPGAVLDEALLDEDVAALRAALHRAGFRRARVGAPAVSVLGTRAVVEFPVEAGPRLALRFVGHAAFPAQTLEGELGLEPDAPVDASALEGAAERLRLFYRARGYAEARVAVDEVRAGGMLAAVFRVEEGRRYRLATIRIEGVAWPGAAELRARLVAALSEEGTPPDDAAEAARALLVSMPAAPPPRAPPAPLAAGEFWEEVAWERAAERLVDDARAEGWLEAVYLGSSLSLDARGGVAEVVLRFRDGPRTMVESITFEGNREVPLAELVREARLAPQDPLVWARVEATRAALQRLYLSRGNLYARVEAREEIDRARAAAALRFVVDEGPRVRIGRILLTGNRRTRAEVVREALAIREGDTYDPEAVAKSQAALLRLGVFRSVALRVHEPEAPQETKDLAVDVVERPWATLTQGIGYSLADGPRATGEFGMPNLFGRALELTARAKVNYPINTPWAADSTLGRLVGSRVELEDLPLKDVIEGRVDLGLRSPRLGLPVPASVGTGLLGEILHRRAYDLRRVAAIAGVEMGVTSRLAVALQYELEVDDIEKKGTGALTQADLERLRFADGVTTLHALRPSITLDRRDNSVHPHSGWYASTSLEWARSLGGPDEAALWVLPGSDIHTNLLKLAGVVSGYLPLGSSVLALSLRGGQVFPLDSRSQTIIPRRFFMGGAATMRGFSEEEMVPEDVRGGLASEARHCATSTTGVGCTEAGRRLVEGERPTSEGGEAFVLGKAELRVPVRGSLEGGLFVDMGNLWLDPERYRLVDLRTNVGLGLRFVTPVGPAAIDVGFNVDPDDDVNERSFALHFTIGLFQRPASPTDATSRRRTERSESWRPGSGRDRDRCHGS